MTIALMFATVMQSLDTTIANVALPHMQGSMSATQDQITWVLTSYVVMAGICTPLTGYLVTRFGRKRLFLASVLCFTIVSMLCGVAQTLEQIVLCRILQGAAGAFLMPLSQAIVMDVYPQERHASILSIWSMGVMFAPILGPTVGGYLTEAQSWRWVFYINLPIGILAAVGTALFLSESKRDLNAKIDLLGFGLLGTGIGALQLMLDRGTTLDWFSSGEIVLEAVVAALAFYTFIAHMFTAAHPFLSRAAFKNPNYALGLFTAFLVITVSLGTAAVLPAMLQNLMGYPVLTAGLVMMPRGLGGLIVMPMMGLLLRTFDARVIIVIGLAIAAGSLWQMSQFTLDVGNQEIMVNGLLQGMGTGMVFLPLTTVTFSTLDAKFRTEASSMFALIRNLGIAIGVSMDSTLLTRNTQINHAELAANITPFNRALQALVPTLTAKGADSAMMLDGEVNRQAGMIAYDDVYRLSMYLVICAAVLVTLLRLPKTGVPDKPVLAEV